MHHVRTHHGTHGRARRPRRAVPTGTTSGTTSGRGPPGTSAPTNMHNTHHVHAPYPHAMPNAMVGRDVPGAPHPRGRHRGRHRERHRVRGPPGTSAPTNMHNTHHVHAPCTRHARTHAHTPFPYPRTMAPMVGRDVPGAPRPRGRHRGRHVYAGRRAAVPRNAVSDFAATPFPSLAAAQSSRRPTGRNEISLRNNLEGNNLEDAEIAGSRGKPRRNEISARNNLA